MEVQAMRIFKIRIQCDNEQDAQDARRLIEVITQEGLKLQKPREGTNPKYEGRQKWASYGDGVIEALLAVADEIEGLRARTAHNGPAETGATIRIAKPKRTRRKSNGKGENGRNE
jgi:hypothetical protein